MIPFNITKVLYVTDQVLINDLIKTVELIKRNQ